MSALRFEVGASFFIGLRARALRVYFGLDGVLVVSCVDDEEAVTESLMKLIDMMDEKVLKEGRT